MRSIFARNFESSTSLRVTRRPIPRTSIELSEYSSRNSIHKYRYISVHAAVQPEFWSLHWSITWPVNLWINWGSAASCSIWQTYYPSVVEPWRVGWSWSRIADAMFRSIRQFFFIATSSFIFHDQLLARYRPAQSEAFQLPSTNRAYTRRSEETNRNALSLSYAEFPVGPDTCIQTRTCISSPGAKFKCGRTCKTLSPKKELMCGVFRSWKGRWLVFASHHRGKSWSSTTFRVYLPGYGLRSPWIVTRFQIIRLNHRRIDQTRATNATRSLAQKQYVPDGLLFFIKKKKSYRVTLRSDNVLAILNGWMIYDLPRTREGTRHTKFPCRFRGTIKTNLQLAAVWLTGTWSIKYRHRQRWESGGEQRTPRILEQDVLWTTKRTETLGLKYLEEARDGVSNKQYKAQNDFWSKTIDI